MKSWKKYLAECIGTFVLTFVGCGVAVVTNCSFNNVAGLVGTALAFGGAIVALAYVIGPVSGCHVNPAVSLAMFINKKLSLKDFLLYVVSQFIGGLVAGGLLFLVFFYLRKTGDALGSGLGSNAIQDLLKEKVVEGLTVRYDIKPLSYVLAFLGEVVLTGIFVFTILGVTSKAENGPVGGLVIGGSLAFVHLMGIGLTGTSVNPARSFGPAIFAIINGQTDPIKQIWIFLLAPLVGAAIAAVLFRFVFKEKEAE